MRFAACEMFVDLGGRPVAAGLNVGQVLRRAISRQAALRRTLVRKALSCAREEGVDILVFPLWTLPGRVPPQWFVVGSQGMTVNIEMFGTGGSGRLPGKGKSPGKGGADDPPCLNYVLAGGRYVIEGAEQLIFGSPDVADYAWMVLKNPNRRRWWRRRAEDGEETDES